MNICTKVINYKLFGYIIASKEEVLTDYEGQISLIEVKKDYFDSEFNLDNKQQDN